MNCTDCVFYSRRFLAHEYVDWCSHHKSQKEITNDTMICARFIAKSTSKNKWKQEDAPTSPLQTPPSSSPQTEIPADLPTVIPQKQRSNEERRQLAYKAEEAIHRLLQNKEMRAEVEDIYEFLQPIVDNEREKELKRKYHISTSYNDFVPVKEVSKMINGLINGINHYEKAKEDVGKYQRVQQDILHALEIAELTDDQMTEYAKELRLLRLFRRQAKNFVETIEPLYEYAVANKQLIEDLKKVSSQTGKIVKEIEARKYFVREDQSMKKAFEKSEPLHIRLNEVIGS